MEPPPTWDEAGWKEDRIQKTYVDWLGGLGTVLFSATVGGVNVAHQWERVKMLLMGYSPGIPDVMIYEPRGCYHGLCIEFKTPRGILSDNQVRWRDALRERGYYWVCARSATHAAAVTCVYLQMSAE